MKTVKTTRTPKNRRLVVTPYSVQVDCVKIEAEMLKWVVDEIETILHFTERQLASRLSDGVRNLVWKVEAESRDHSLPISDFWANLRAWDRTSLESPLVPWMFDDVLGRPMRTVTLRYEAWQWERILAVAEYFQIPPAAFIRAAIFCDLEKVRAYVKKRAAPAAC